MGTLVDNGGCYFNGEIKNWLPFRQNLFRSSDGMGLGWVYEIANVLSVYLQKAVAEMSKKDQEAGDIATDFAKFSDTFGSNYMDHTKCGYDKEEDLAEAHEQCDLVYLSM
jgi:hypothetical protein